MKKLGKRKVGMGKLCVEKGLWPQKLKNPMNKTFGSKVNMFQEVLEDK
jgi:hypothetical protein